MTNDIASRILHCDSACVVVNKIAGEAVEGAGRGMINLCQLLAAELSSAELPPDALALPTAVHRIDVPVSGCVVFARSGEALRFLNTAFSDNGVKKLYWAVVEPPENNALFSADAVFSGELIHWIQFNPQKNKSTAYDEPGPGRKKAVLRCRLAGRGANYLFLEIELITGRHHQIRAQLERLGLHIKGDLKYGARRSEPNGGIRLHARSISFPHPSNKDSIITAQADPPLRDNLWQAFEEAVFEGILFQ
ncbi:MAG: RNA pseudouridine synthase [Treponema sp.]|jgi:23S rRNA pseudouridine1911/1915/1917 synthase|nr:RNA pseudouridine synthase [Treponema sp.]